MNTDNSDYLNFLRGKIKLAQCSGRLLDGALHDEYPAAQP